MNFLLPFPMIKLEERFLSTPWDVWKLCGLTHEWIKVALICVYLQQKMLLLGLTLLFCQICLNSSIQGFEAFFFQNWLYPE